MAGTRELNYIFGRLSINGDPAVIDLFSALIDEIGRLEKRIEVLERVREFNERGNSVAP